MTVYFSMSPGTIVIWHWELGIFCYTPAILRDNLFENLHNFILLNCCMFQILKLRRDKNEFVFQDYSIKQIFIDLVQLHEKIKVLETIHRKDLLQKKLPKLRIYGCTSSTTFPQSLWKVH